MNSNPLLQTIHNRNELYRTIRNYFNSRGYLEVHTPLLASRPIPESHIELFRTERRFSDGTREPLYLLPSPELGMKLLLASGSPSLYQISPCFRNGEQLDRWHRLEFTMLEWYRLEAEADDNIKETQQLLEACAQSIPSAGRAREAFSELTVMTMEEAFREFAGFSLENDLRGAGLAQSAPWDKEYPAALRTAASVLSKRLSERGMPSGAPGEDAADLFHRLFLTLVEDRLPREHPLVLKNWPSLIPTLARSIPHTPWADRWELYIHGVEVANCYGEENSRKALESYWENEKAQYKTEAESGEWIQRVSEGMPACSGAAMGLDRLLALLQGSDSLKGVDLFPFLEL